jgi:hypothetical protein
MQRFLLDALSDGVSAVQASDSSLPLEGSGLESGGGQTLDAVLGCGGME